MGDTEQLIASLAGESKPVARLSNPIYLLIRTLAAFAIYGVLIILVEGVRPDISLQLTRPLFLAELVALLLLIVASLASSIYLLFPDMYQQAAIRRLPFMALGFYAVIVLIQFIYGMDTQMATGLDHTMECVACIVVVAIIPSILLSILGRKGATTYPLALGWCLVLTATAMGGLVLRLIEMQDDPAHILLLHTVPMLILASIGAVLGRRIFTW